MSITSDKARVACCLPYDWATVVQSQLQTRFDYPDEEKSSREALIKLSQGDRWVA